MVSAVSPADTVDESPIDNSVPAFISLVVWVNVVTPPTVTVRLFDLAISYGIAKTLVVPSPVCVDWYVEASIG